MRLPVVRSALALLAFGTLSCAEAPTGPASPPVPTLSLSTASTYPAVVISQVYGGGGNTGATLKNDFVELFNPGTVAVDVSGWRVLYASATGSTWNATPLAGVIQPGGYYLIQQAAGAGGTVALPTPDATGSTAMAAGAGKVVLATSTAVVTGTCPAGVGIVDMVSFGTTATACGALTTPTLSATLAAVRNEGGCAYTGSLQADFSVGAPTPRNSASPATACGGPPPDPAIITSVAVTPAEATAFIGTTQAFAAAARDAQGNAVASTFDWSSSDVAVATVDANGIVTALSQGSATIEARAPNGVSGSAALTVTPPPPVGAVPDVVISQVYGGGGNSGATYTHDFVELFNRGSAAVDVTGWLIHYGSAGGSAIGITTSIAGGIIQPGRYFLVQLSSNNTAVGAPLPTPDATGAINAGAGSGKFVLTLPGVTLSGSCPSGAGIVDRVGFGSTNCATDWGGNTTVISSTTSLFRNNDGCVKTGSTAGDFAAGAVQPRNSASPAKNCVQPPRPQSAATLVINELMRDPVYAESMSWGQWFEVHNYGASPIDLQGWTIITAGSNQPDHVISRSVVVPAGGYAVLGRGADEARNGGVSLAYNYFTGTSSTIWLDASDYLMLVDGAGARADSVAWTSLPRGVSVALRSAALPHSDVAGSAWGFSTSTYGDGDYGTPGAVNAPLADAPPFVSPNRITFSGRTAADGPVPVGFEVQVFASLRNEAGVAIETQVTFEALTPTIATIDSRGVVRALAPGEARFRASATDGTARILALLMETALPSTTAQYGNHLEFGQPVDADPTDDFIIRRREFVTSWNPTRGIPNWVAYNLNLTQMPGGQDRCNCFTFDPELEAAGFPRYTTADYTGAGAFHGYGIDRGHLVRSFDRTAGALDNARTYYFSNIIPQAADMNQGPWAMMEIYLGDLARYQDKEVYIYAGASGSIGTVKNEGRIVIPRDNWKVALILPRGMGLGDVRDYRDVEVIAAVMPNVSGIRNVDWQAAYRVTVDSVEALSGYTFMSVLPADVQQALKSNTKPPLGRVDGPYTTVEGSELTVSAAGSVDPNGSIVSYAWSFGDGSIGAGLTSTHTYALTGTYTVRLVVTDNDGLADTVTTTAQVGRIDPAVGLANLETIVEGLLESGALSRGEANSLLAKIRAAAAHLAGGNRTPVVNQVGALIRELEALVRSGRIDAATAERIRFEAERLNRALMAQAA